jgi:putative hydrolase of the HAD superfamily
MGVGLMLEAVIWDFGGVLTSSPFEAFARFETEHGLPADIIRRTNAANHLENAWAKFERAEVDIEAFDRLFAAESLTLGAEVRGRDVLPLLSGDLRPEMVEALKRIKTRFKTGCITNNLPANAIGSAGGRTLYIAEVMMLFDHVIESAKIGLRKPDPRIYRMMIEALGVDPKRCVYLDDLGVNLKPARAMGMTTIKVLNAPQALAELEAVTGLSLR